MKYSFTGDTMQLRVPAKLNLTLDVLSRREDGYHEIASVMQSVSIFDQLTLRLRPEPGVTLSSSLPFLPIDQRNLASRAALVFLQHTGQKVGVEISIKKRIPVGAGMGGGSADAAAVLFGLDRLLHTRLSEKELATLALTLGADVPFFLLGGTALAEGIGERLTPLPLAPRCTLVVAKPRYGISTPVLYQRFDQRGIHYPPATPALVQALRRPMTAAQLAGLCSNAMQEAAVEELPAIGQMLQELTEAGALSATMTGSGS
ncbi:MAG: 4-(cytidine 5'-diphospho)-2-C-methyl-D-erythritol kinase, partial [Clostridia bacterium]|nr:4-(cytidine 5'-diphospho)-2-C-methyl-D-erythritol kinase [Clostridia bacterium]